MSTSTHADPSPTARRTPLDRGQVLTAALALVDRDGLGALSMRRLAAQLGVEAMSLYKHVENKDDLLTGLTDLLWAEIAADSPADDDWPTWLRTFGHAIRDAGRRHPNALPVLVTGEVCPVSALALFADQLEHAVADQGQLVNALRTVAAFALGCVVTEVSCFGPSPANREESDRQRLLRVSRALPADAPERILDTAMVVCGDCDVQRLFDDGLELIVRGCQLDQPAQAT